jgi:hypothetical protein
MKLLKRKMHLPAKPARYPPCKGTNVRGKPCGLLADGDDGYCSSHRPEASRAW